MIRDGKKGLRFAFHALVWVAAVPVVGAAVPGRGERREEGGEGEGDTEKNEWCVRGEREREKESAMGINHHTTKKTRFSTRRTKQCT